MTAGPVLGPPWSPVPGSPKHVPPPTCFPCRPRLAGFGRSRPNRSTHLPRAAYQEAFMKCIRPLRGGFRYTANAWTLMPVQGVECGWKPGGWPEMRIYGYITSGCEIPEVFRFQNSPPSPHRSRYPSIYYATPCAKQTWNRLPIRTPRVQQLHIYS